MKCSHHPSTACNHIGFQPTIQQNVSDIIQAIHLHAEKAHRPADSVQLLAVSKTHPTSAIEAAVQAGLTAFGENYAQELAEKVSYFREVHPKLPLSWHFIGPIQSNKTKLIAEYADWVHTVDRLKIAQRLSEQRSPASAPLNVLIQLNLQCESSKAGLTDEHALAELIQQVNALPHLRLRGLMAIPKADVDPHEQHALLIRITHLFLHHQTQQPHWDTLSLGMSQDMAEAIAAGSTMVRIGSAIFGVRPAKP